MALILYSGGLDSLIMDTMAKSQGIPVQRVFFNIGQPNIVKELCAIERLIAGGMKIDVREIDWLQNAEAVTKEGSASGDIYIPGRNLVLATLGASIYLPDEVWLGALYGETHDSATDKNDRFREMTGETLSYVLSPFQPTGVKIRFPLAERMWNKLSAAHWALNNGLTPQQMVDSSSCLKADGGAHGKCGECIVCLRRWGLFTILQHTSGQQFPEHFITHPLKSEANQRVLISMLTKGYYERARCAEVLPALPIYANARGIGLVNLLYEIGVDPEQLTDTAEELLHPFWSVRSISA